MTSVRTALAEGLTAANNRMSPINGILAWSGAAVRANRYYSLAIGGGHSNSQDDGFYEFDTNTNTWICRIVPSTFGDGSTDSSDTFGEYPGLGETRPASQHSYQHLVAVGNDIIQGMGYAINHTGGGGSKQGHIWKESTGLWTRFGQNAGGVQNGVGVVVVDTLRGQIVRWSTNYNANVVDSIATSATSGTAWTETSHPFDKVLTGTGDTSYYTTGAYHEDLDCFVSINQPGFAANTIYVMAAGNKAAGWIAVSTSGSQPPSGYNCPEYIPPLGYFAVPSSTEPTKLYYLKPNASGVITDAWSWASETFTGTSSAWDTSGNPAAYPHSRLRWCASKRGLLCLKGPNALMELFVPYEVAAYYDWVDRAAQSGVVASYDFTTPANGGDYRWGSTSASPKTTVFAMNESSYGAGGSGGQRRFIDTATVPPGSKKCMRFDIPTNTGEAADAWRISLDNYADQFGENADFWLVWRARFNTAYAQTAFNATGGGLTGSKLAMVSAGMQRPYVYEGSSKSFAGYENPGATTFNAAANIMQDARIDSDGEIVLRKYTVPAGTSSTANGPVGTTFQYHGMYSSKFFDDLATAGTGAFANKYTRRNGGSESSPFTNATAWFAVEPTVYDDHTTAWKFPANEWVTFAIHVHTGAWQSNAANSIGTSHQGFADSSYALYAARSGETSWTLIHKRTGIALVSIPQGGSPATGGAEGVQKFGQFGFTTFMTAKDSAQSHSTASYWVGQIIVKSGAAQPTVPAY